MSIEIVQRGAKRVIGITARIDPTKADYCELWGKRFGVREEEVRTLTGGSGYCGVYFGTGQPGQVDFIAGMFSASPSAVASLPEGLVQRDVPGGSYALFRCTMSSIAPTWHRIYGQELPASDYEEDPERPCFEEYPPDASGPDAPVLILVPVHPK